MELKIGWDNKVDADFELRSLDWMLRTARDEADPWPIVEEWLCEAGEGDEDHLKWALIMWKTIVNMTALDLEAAITEVRRRRLMLGE